MLQFTGESVIRPIISNDTVDRLNRLESKVVNTCRKVKLKPQRVMPCMLMLVLPLVSLPVLPVLSDAANDAVQNHTDPDVILASRSF